ncbi:methionyl-tRNA formyltransferase [Pseudomonas sp.]|uniref:methionyl-tRNA formyltransferase n=1 Tax=Pseudomonas sp. TaxID=306 RepID=UPI003C74DDC2
MITLLTTLEPTAELFKVVDNTGLISRVFRSRDELDQVNDAIMLLINWPYILHPDFIARQRVVLNVHNSLLPRYRGRHAFTWAILNGERELGFSLHRVVAAVDAGEVFAQTAFPLAVEEDVNGAFRRGEEILNSWLPGTLLDWAEGRLVAHPQDETHASSFRRRHAEDNWLMSFDRAEQVRDLIRAVAPPYTSGAMSRTTQGEILHFASSQVVDSVARGEPGRIVAIDKLGISVACADGIVRLVPVERELLDRLCTGDTLVAEVL